MDSLDKGEKPYLQFTETFDEMLKTIETHHGKKEVQKVLKLINKQDGIQTQ
jgi:hypothetical protein